MLMCLVLKLARQFTSMIFNVNLNLGFPLIYELAETVNLGHLCLVVSPTFYIGGLSCIWLVDVDLRLRLTDEAAVKWTAAIYLRVLLPMQNLQKTHLHP